jgi:hypothetical protein
MKTEFIFILIYLLSSYVDSSVWGTKGTDAYGEAQLHRIVCECDKQLNITSNGMCLNTTSNEITQPVCIRDPYWGAVFLCWGAAAFAVAMILATSIQLYVDIRTTWLIFIKSGRVGRLYYSIKTSLKG